MPPVRVSARASLPLMAAPEDYVVCGQCDKKMLSRHQGRHAEVHLPDDQKTWYLCPFEKSAGCSFKVTLSKKANLKGHIRREHGVGRLSCTECAFVTLHDASMSRHYKKHHKGKKNPGSNLLDILPNPRILYPTSTALRPPFFSLATHPPCTRKNGAQARSRDESGDKASNATTSTASLTGTLSSLTPSNSELGYDHAPEPLPPCQARALEASMSSDSNGELPVIVDHIPWDEWMCTPPGSPELSHTPPDTFVCPPIPDQDHLNQSYGTVEMDFQGSNIPPSPQLFDSGLSVDYAVFGEPGSIYSPPLFAPTLAINWASYPKWNTNSAISDTSNGYRDVSDLYLLSDVSSPSYSTSSVLSGALDLPTFD